MQKQLIIDLDSWKKSGLYFLDYGILQLLYEGVNIRDYNIFDKKVNIDDIFKSLEKQLYIKILDDGEIESRAKLIKLFEENNSKKEEEIDEVLLYLKQKAGYSDRFNIKLPAHRKFISARFKEKHTVVDLKKVIDLKCEQWIGSKMEDYLRPATLFNAEKFSSYMIEVDKKNKQIASLNKMV